MENQLIAQANQAKDAANAAGPAALDFLQAAQDQLPGAQAVVQRGAEGGFGSILSGLLSAVMVIAALLVLLNLIWGAIDWITAGGDSGKVQKAREKITQSVIGIIVLASALAIFMIMQRLLGINVLSFGGGSGASRNGSGGSGGNGGTAICQPNSHASTGSGAASYCTTGSTRVACVKTANIDYYHWEPCRCETAGASLKPGYSFLVECPTQ